MSRSRIAQGFDRLRKEGRPAFVPYLCAGDPGLETTYALARMLEEEGADLLELGVPHTDPVSDGPTNQRGAERALASGVRPIDVLDLAQRLQAEGCILPVVLFTYANPLLALLAQRPMPWPGIDGILVTDLPPEEAGEHIARCRQHGVDTIFLCSPTTPSERIPRIASASSGFLYVVSRKGVTGSQQTLPEELGARLSQIRSHCNLPLCVGFGISNRALAARVASEADGFVVGSALMAQVEEAQAAGEDPVQAARSFVQALDPRPPVGR